MIFSPSDFTRVAVLLALIASPALRAQESPVSLRLHWLSGKTYTQETITETTAGLTAIGKPEDQKMKVKQTTRIEVKESSAGQKEARVTFEALSGEVMMQGKKQTFDSQNLAEAHPMIRASVGQSVGKSFILVYDAEDQFLKVADTGAMSPDPLGTPSLEGIAEAKQIAELYRRSLEMGLPKMQVKPGDRWTSQETVQFPSAGTVNVELRVKFDSLVNYEGRSHAKISFEGDMKRADEDAGSRSVTLGKGSKTFGQILFDLDRGTVSFGAFRADIQLETLGKTIPVRQQVTTKLVKME